MDVFNFFFFFFTKPGFTTIEFFHVLFIAIYGIWNKTTVYDKFEERCIVSVIKGYVEFMIRIKY